MKSLSGFLSDNAFELVYLAISIATFSHTSWAFATIFEGNMPPEGLALGIWTFKGALGAITIDIGMLVTAKKITKQFSLVLFLSFFVLAMASFYTQILFALHHTDVWVMGEGVSPYWQELLDPLIQGRVVLVALMLPAFATIFTIARMVETRQTIKKEESLNARFIKQAQNHNGQEVAGIFVGDDGLYHFDFSINGSKTNHFGPFESYEQAKEKWDQLVELRVRVNDRSLDRKISKTLSK